MFNTTIQQQLDLNLPQVENEGKMTYKQRSVLDLALQVLNGKSNFYQEESNVTELFKIYKQVFEGEQSKEYCTSMENSRALYPNKQALKESLASLKNNTSDSFLIIPIPAAGHMFASVVRKIDDKFSAVVVNKGGRKKHSIYEEYVMDEKKAVDSFEKILKDRFTIEEVYNTFSSNADATFVYNIAAKDQKIGNCFIKEPENAIKFATATSKYSLDKIKSFRNSADAMKIKWPGTTYMTHKKFVNELIKENPSLDKILKEELNIYLSNKTFRLSLDRMDFEKALHFSFSPITDTKGMDSSKKTLELLKQVNVDTIVQTNRKFEDFFLKNVKDPSAKKLVHDLRYYFMVGSAFSSKLFIYEGLVNLGMWLGRKKTFNEKLIENLDIGKKYFPRAVNQIQYDFHTGYMMAGLIYSNLNYTDKASEKFETAENMYKYNADLTLFKGLHALNNQDLKTGVMHLENAVASKNDFKEAQEFLDQFGKMDETTFERFQNRNFFIEYSYKKGVMDDKDFKAYVEGVVEQDKNDNIETTFVITKEEAENIPKTAKKDTAKKELNLKSTLLKKETGGMTLSM